jgi:hypothetical protein
MAVVTVTPAMQRPPVADHGLEDVFLAELRLLNARVAQLARSTRPDLAEMRDLARQIASTRRKLAAAQGEPPPHTD